MADDSAPPPSEAIRSLPNKKRRLRATKQKMKEREEQIIHLRNQGKSNQQIAKLLNRSYSQIASMVSKLIQQGQIVRDRRGRSVGFQQKNATWRDINNQRVQLIVKLKKQRATLKAIGNELGVTEERARQLIEKVVAEHGEDIFTPKELTWTVPEAASELRINYKVIYSLCQQGEIPCQRRSQGRAYLLTQESVEALKQHPKITGERVCIICKCKYIYVHGQTYKLTCSQACREERKRMYREKILAKDPSPDSLHGWQCKLWQRIQSYKPSQSDTWLTISKVAAITGLSMMQVWWLQQRRVVTTRDHPTKQWRGKPVKMYAASEVEIAKKVYRAYKAKHKKKD